MECILKDIIKIQKAIREKTLVIFVGAGVSANSGVPTWGTLIDKIAKELKIEKDIQQNEYLKIAQYYYNNNPKTFFTSIKNFLDVERQLNSINEYLFKEFKPKYFVTTNYDDTLEKINPTGIAHYTVELYIHPRYPIGITNISETNRTIVKFHLFYNFAFLDLEIYTTIAYF